MTSRAAHTAPTALPPVAAATLLAALGEAVDGAEGWRAASACRQVGPGPFFPDRGDTATAAKRVCAGCSVRAECLAAALTRREAHGVWGGMTPNERAQLLRMATGRDTDSSPATAQRASRSGVGAA